MNTNNEIESRPVELPRSPDLGCVWEAYLFDMSLLARKPLGGRFLRRCVPFELPPGKFEELSDGDKCVLLSISEYEPGVLRKVVFACSEQEVRECHIRSNAVGQIAQIVSANGNLHTGYIHGDELIHQTTTPFFVRKVIGFGL